LVNYLNAYQFDWYPDKHFSPVIPSISTALQTEAYNKQFALIEGLGSVVISPSISTGVNNIMSLINTNTTIKISAKDKTVRAKFSGETKSLFSSDISLTAAQIAVFGLDGNSNPTNPNANLDPAIKNINSYGNGNFILATNSAGTIFAIPSPLLTPNSNFIDAVTDISVLTSGQLGYQLNPLKAYRHNGVAIELYDFVLMGRVNWGGATFSSLINYGFNGKSIIKQDTLATATTYSLNNILGSNVVKYQKKLICKVAEKGYLINEEIEIDGDGNSGTSVEWYGTFIIQKQANNGNFKLRTGATGIGTVGANGDVNAPFTPANWKCEISCERNF